MSEERLKKQLEFLVEIDKMKNVLRRTLIVDGSRRENDAEHSWHLAMLAMVLEEYSEREINISRVVRMCLVHDLVEVYAGDTFAYDEKGYEDKLARETAAADKLFSMLPTEQGEEFRALWREFDEAQTADAMYAAAMDRLQPMMNNFNCAYNTPNFMMNNTMNGYPYNMMRGNEMNMHPMMYMNDDVSVSNVKMYKGN